MCLSEGSSGGKCQQNITALNAFDVKSHISIYASALFTRWMAHSLSSQTRFQKVLISLLPFLS